MHVWHVNLDTHPANVGQLSALLDSQERARAAKFSTPVIRDRYIVAHGVMRQLLAEYADTQPSAIQYEYKSHGKPVLADPALTTKLAFNLTHSGNLALLAISDGRSIGVDIEKIKPHNDLDQVAHRNFSSLERSALSTLNKSDLLIGFYNLWTRKEAFIKAIGDGVSYPLDSFVVPVQPHPRSIWTPIFRDDADHSHWVVQDISRLPDYAAAVVCDNASMKVVELVLPA